jgi:hypothetical protein
MKKIIGFLVVITFSLILLGFKFKQEDGKCTKWSPSYNGVYYRYCNSSEYSTYKDQLHWYNANEDRVYVTWKWAVYNDYIGTSATYVKPDETEISAIEIGYRIVSVTVEQK